jgi:antitoxin (DNA-binding transcriptional repressor) of toxin-antitoxin stability system
MRLQIAPRRAFEARFKQAGGNFHSGMLLALGTRQRILIRINRCDTMSHMKTITIRELHQATGRWVRRASAGEVYVTERGRLVAKIVPASPLPAKPFFADPKFTRAFLANRKHLRGGTDSTQAISEERSREVL